MSNERVIASYFAAMRRGPEAEEQMMELFTDDIVYVEPFTGAGEPAVGRAAVRDRLRAGWESPLPDMELDVLRVESTGTTATARWECRSPALPDPVRGTDVYTFTDGRINRLEVALDAPVAGGGDADAPAPARRTMYHSVEIEGSADAVWAAVATQSRVRAWWTSTAEMESHVGGRLSVWFQNRSIAMTHRIDELDRGAGHLQYTCVDHVDNPEWLHTCLDWRLRSAGTTTRLHLEHRNWAANAALYADCDRGWGRFLASIKQLVETDRGNPID